jgi:hypothetical protein
MGQEGEGGGGISDSISGLQNGGTFLLLQLLSPLPLIRACNFAKSQICSRGRI